MIRVRSAVWGDMEAIMDLEACWPEGQRAGREQMEARLEKFPPGFLVAENAAGVLVGSVTGSPILYDSAHPEGFRTWAQVTNGGIIRRCSEVPDANALYLVSGIVHPDHRGGEALHAMIRAEVEVARSLGFAFVAAGAVIPGYRRYCERHGPVPAADYVFLRKGHRFVDPLMDQYRRLGFRVPDRRHVIPDYYPDPDSGNFAAFVVHEVAAR